MGKLAPVKKFLIHTTRSIAVIYVLVVLAVAGCQRSLMYHPMIVTEAAALARGKNASLEPWRAADGSLLGWRRPNPAAANRMIVFHGNAGSAQDRESVLRAFQTMNQGRDWEVFLFEYPGYGARRGSPGKDAFIEAGKQAAQVLLADDARPLFVYGESLGSCIACPVAAALPDRIAGVALMTPLARMRDVAAMQYSWLPTGLILRDRYDNITALESYHGPVGLVVAGRDGVVSTAQGQLLHDTYAGPKHLTMIPDAGHNGIPASANEEWCQVLSRFLQESGGKK